MTLQAATAAVIEGYGNSPRRTREAQARTGGTFLQRTEKRGGTFQLTRLQAIHHEILRLKLTGLKNVRIAELLGITVAMVQYTVNSSIGKRKLAMMQAAKDVSAIDWNRSMQKLLPDCHEAFKDGLNPEIANLELRVKVATIVAEKFAGVAVPKQIAATHAHTFLSPEDIEAVKRRGLEQAVAAGLIVEAEFEEIDNDEE